MKPLIQAIRELKFGVSKVHLFEILLNAIIIFLGTYLFFSVFDIPIILSVAISMAYSIVDLAKIIARSKIREVELYYPKLRERLRTAAENVKTENPVANELKEEVLSDLRYVQEAEFLDERRATAKAAIAALLCFLILMLAPVSLKLDFIEPAIAKAKQVADINLTIGEATGESDIVVGSGGQKPGMKIDSETNIYGPAKIAKLGEEELKLVIRPAGDIVNVRQAKDVEGKEFSDSYPKEIAAVSAASYEEKIPREQQEMVKNYFAAIAKG